MPTRIQSGAYARDFASKTGRVRPRPFQSVPDGQHPIEVVGEKRGDDAMDQKNKLSTRVATDAAGCADSASSEVIDSAPVFAGGRIDRAESA
jgi:hypothetical protein